MKADEIKELIDKIKNSEKQTFMIKVVNVGYIELEKSEVLKILEREYSDEKLYEFRNWIDTKNIRYNDLAERMNIHPVKFTQMISGHIKSTKEVGNTLDFINKCKSLII